MGRGDFRREDFEHPHVRNRACEQIVLPSSVRCARRDGQGALGHGERVWGHGVLQEPGAGLHVSVGPAGDGNVRDHSSRIHLDVRADPAGNSGLSGLRHGVPAAAFLPNNGVHGECAVDVLTGQGTRMPRKEFECYGLA